MCVIDVVEGLQSVSVGIAGCLANYVFPHTEFTLDALPLMHSLLNARPEGFDSPEEAIEWQCVGPNHFIYGLLAAHLRGFDASVNTHTIRNPTSARVSVPAIIVPAPEGSPPSTPAYLWRTPLRSTAAYWNSKSSAPSYACLS